MNKKYSVPILISLLCLACSNERSETKEQSSVSPQATKEIKPETKVTPSVQTAPSVAEWTLEPRTYRGVEFTATMNDIRGAIPDVKCYDQIRECGDSYQLGAIPAKDIWVFGKDGRIQSINVSFGGAYYDDILSILKDKYGPPNFNGSYWGQFVSLIISAPNNEDDFSMDFMVLSEGKTQTQRDEEHKQAVDEL